MLFEVSIGDPLFAAGAEKTDRIGGVGDGDEGGLKSSYLTTRHANNKFLFFGYIKHQQ